MNGTGKKSPFPPGPEIEALLALCTLRELPAAAIDPPAEPALRELQHHIIAFKRRTALLEGETERLHERAWRAAAAR